MSKIQVKVKSSIPSRPGFFAFVDGQRLYPGSPVIFSVESEAFNPLWMEKIEAPEKPKAKHKAGSREVGGE